jgi:hypothetical protein
MHLYWLPHPECYVTFLTFTKFYLPAMPSPPPCYIIPPFDARTYLGSKNIILIQTFVFPQHHYMGSCFSFYSGLHNGPD